ncbi:DNA polymerase, partial [Citrobacter braakii]
IADPDGGRNIRLKGAIYEQSFNAGEGLRAEIESAAADYRRDAESRIQRAREVCQSGTERKREENQRRHPRPRPEAVLSHEPANERDAAHGQPDVADHRAGLRAADRLERGNSVVAGAADTRELHDHPGAEEHAGHAVREEQRRTAIDLRRAETPLREGEPGSGTVRRGFELDDTGGEIAHDGAGKTVAERIRAATAGLLEKAGRVGELLRGMADDVWSYATGERGAERARHGLEQAGAEFERAAAPVVVKLNGIEARLEQERAAQHQKALELERSQRQKGFELGM